MAPTCEGSSFQTVFAFVCLSLVRGTTPLSMFYGVHFLRSPALVVALKCAVSLCLFVLSAIIILRRSAARTVIASNLTTRSTYWKLFCVGLLQSAAPYLLAVYAAQYVPITFVSVFMVTTPWWILLHGRFFHAQNGKRVPGVVKGGIMVGIIGIIIMMVPIVVETVQCVVEDKNLTDVNSSNVSSNVSRKVYVELHSAMSDCHHFTEVLTGFIACLSAPLLWAIAAVFWKKHQGDIHHIVGSIGQNVFGGIITSLIWYIVGRATTFEHINWNGKWWIGCILYLGVATGWLGTLLLRYLYNKLGSKSRKNIHQVLTAIPIITFIEDCLLIRDMLTMYSYTVVIELLGLLVVTLGVFISNVPRDDPQGKRPHSKNDERTERLLSSHDEQYDEGRDDDSDQTLITQVEQYERSIDHVAYDADSDNDIDNEQSIEGPPSPKKRIRYPIITEIS